MTQEKPAAAVTADPKEESVAPGRSSSRRTILVGVVLAVAVIAGFAGYDALSDDAPAADGMIPSQQGQRLGAVSGAEDTPLPDVTLDGFGEGEPVSTASYRGTPLVVNFWATWCPPCVEEMPDFEAVWRSHGGAVAFLGVNTQDREADAVEFAGDLGITYDMASDPTGAFFAEISGYGWPTTLLVDAEGQIRYRHTGPLDAAELRSLLAEHLGVAS